MYILYYLYGGHVCTDMGYRHVCTCGPRGDETPRHQVFEPKVEGTYLIYNIPLGYILVGSGSEDSTYLHLRSASHQRLRPQASPPVCYFWD